jgi:hypothetical protein
MWFNLAASGASDAPIATVGQVSRPCRRARESDSRRLRCPKVSRQSLGVDVILAARSAETDASLPYRDSSLFP